MAKILDFKANNTTPGTGSLTNVVGPDWNVVRNSVATYKPTPSTVADVAIDVPRIEDGKVIIEPEATNYCGVSEQPFNAYFTGNGARVDGFTDPRGGSTACEVDIQTDADWFKTINTSQVPTNGSMSLWVKKSPNSVSSDDIRLTTNNAGAWNTGITVSFTLTNDWQRVSLEGSLSDTLNSKCMVTNRLADNSIDPNASDKMLIWGMNINDANGNTSYIYTSTSSSATRAADVITNTVPVGTAPITMTTWIDGVSDGGQVVNQGDPITMLDGTTSIEIDDSEVTTTTIEIEWIDSISAAATGNKIYRDDVEIADVANGIQTYPDDTAETGTTYKYEVQAHDGAGDETTQEVTGVNTDTITTA